MLKIKLTAVNIAFVCILLALAIFYVLESGHAGFFSSDGFMPHGHCYLWSPPLVWAMVLSDALIGLAYLSISICLYILVRRIRLPFSAMFLAFGVFIAACGATHFMEVYTLWVPNYWLAAFIKSVTAVASVATAFIMFPLFPKVVEFATAARLSEERGRQLEELNRALEARGEELVTTNRELESFSYSVSHDLRSPLRGIDGFSKALLEDYGERLDPVGREYLDNIRLGAQRMGRIIDDLLNLSRITRKDLTSDKLDLSAMVREILLHLSLLEPDRKVDIFVQGGAQVMGDMGLIQIVLENLLSNSWKFTRKVLGARIEFGVKSVDERQVYFVRDNGAGFDMKYSGKLFGAFQRLHSEEEFSGTGVGLATAKRIIERHSGRIWAESEVGKGTTFYFELGEQK